MTFTRKIAVAFVAILSLSLCSVACRAEKIEYSVTGTLDRGFPGQPFELTMVVEPSRGRGVPASMSNAFTFYEDFAFLGLNDGIITKAFGEVSGISFNMELNPSGEAGTFMRRVAISLVDDQFLSFADATFDKFRLWVETQENNPATLPSIVSANINLEYSASGNTTVTSPFDGREFPRNSSDIMLEDLSVRSVDFGVFNASGQFVDVRGQIESLRIVSSIPEPSSIALILSIVLGFSRVPRRQK